MESIGQSGNRSISPYCIAFLCLLNVAYVATMGASFIMYRFETVAFWGATAFVNLGVQILLACLFFLSRRRLSTGWKIACGCGVALNGVVVALGLLFMKTYVAAP